MHTNSTDLDAISITQLDRVTGGTGGGAGGTGGAGGGAGGAGGNNKKKTLADLLKQLGDSKGSAQPVARQGDIQ